MAKLSIAVCVYNQEDLILRALDSIPNREDIEIVIINDGSTDGTDAAISSWKENIYRYSVKYISYKDNRGIGYARNRALKECTGEYMATLDSDDYFITENFEKVIECLDGADIVYHNLQINDGSIYYLQENTNRMWCAFTCKCVKRSLFEGLEFKEQHRIAEDWFMNEELLKKNPSKLYTGIVAYHYNWPREGSLCWLSSHKEEEDD